METLYFSFDIESDGPVPGINSLMSIGIAIIDANKKIRYAYEINLKPLESAQQDENKVIILSKNKDRYDYLTKDQQDPQEIFSIFKIIIDYLNKKYIIIPIAWSASSDWQFLNYYFCKFTGSNPVGNYCKCISSYLWSVTKSKDHNIDDELYKKYEEEYKEKKYGPLTNAKYQGFIFINIFDNNTLNNSILSNYIVN